MEKWEAKRRVRSPWFFIEIGFRSLKVNGLGYFVAGAVGTIVKWKSMNFCVLQFMVKRVRFSIRTKVLGCVRVGGVKWGPLMEFIVRLC